jgi:hypothetical protein
MAAERIERRVVSLYTLPKQQLRPQKGFFGSSRESLTLGPPVENGRPDRERLVAKCLPEYRPGAKAVGQDDPNFRNVEHLRAANHFDLV